MKIRKNHFLKSINRNLTSISAIQTKDKIDEFTEDPKFININKNPTNELECLKKYQIFSFCKCPICQKLEKTADLFIFLSNSLIKKKKKAIKFLILQIFMKNLRIIHLYLKQIVQKKSIRDF